MVKLMRPSLCIIGLAVVIAGFTTTLDTTFASDRKVSQSMLSVEAVKPKIEDWVMTLQANGLVTAWQDAYVASEVSNLKITDILVDDGSVVHKGDVLARLSQSSAIIDVHKQEAALSEAKANLTLARANAKRARQVKGKGSLSDQQVTEYLVAEQTAQANVKAAKAELENSQLTLTNTTLKAIDDGVITSRTAVLGDVVSIGDELFRMQRKGKIEWRAELDTQQITQVQIGQAATIFSPDGVQAYGHVRAIAPNLDNTTGRGLVYIQMESSNHVKAGSYVNGTITLRTSKALTVPETALVYRDGRTYVFTITQDSHVQQHTVRTGRHYNNAVEILEGIQKDQDIVKAGGAFLNHNAVVTVVSGGAAS